MKIENSGDGPEKIGFDESLQNDIREKLETYADDFQNLYTEEIDFQTLQQELEGKSAIIDTVDRSNYPIIREQNHREEDLSKLLKSQTDDLEIEFCLASYNSQDKIVNAEVIAHNRSDTEKVNILPFLPFFRDFYRPISLEITRGREEDFHVESYYMSPNELLWEKIL